MAHVFLSYSRHDRKLAERVIAALKAEGFSVWWDDDITPWQSWDKTVEQELANAEHVLVIWTPNSLNSAPVRNEADEAASQPRPKLLSLCIGDCEPPRFVRHIQYVKTDEHTLTSSDGWNKLLRWLRESPAQQVEWPMPSEAALVSALAPARAPVPPPSPPPPVQAKVPVASATWPTIASTPNQKAPEPLHDAGEHLAIGCASALGCYVGLIITVQIGCAIATGKMFEGSPWAWNGQLLTLVYSVLVGVLAGTIALIKRWKL